jgi:glycosyltransferase involved in cell wall biosynthesis
MKVLVVTPTYNERDNLPLLAAGVLRHDGYRLLVVDDGSPDGTGAVAAELAKANPGRVEVIHRTGPRGLGTPSWKDARISSARWIATSRTIPSTCLRSSAPPQRTTS